MKKIFRVITQEQNIILFEAIVNHDFTFIVKKDLTGRFENKFKKILNGSYSVKYINNSTEEEKIYHINDTNPLKNINKYIEYCDLLFATRVSFDSI